MVKSKSIVSLAEVKALLSKDPDFLKSMIQQLLQDILEAEMTEALQAAKSERNEARLGYRSGYYDRSLITRIGKIELRVPRDRAGRFSTEVFERYQRSEKALVSALVEMCVQGVSTRKVGAITEQLCGHHFSASSISAMVCKLDEQLKEFSERELEDAFPYLLFDARYEKVREGGAIRSRAVQIAIGIETKGRRQVLAVDIANRETANSWKDFILSLRERGLHGVEYVVSDDHPGLKKAVDAMLPESLWQRCYVHFLRNCLDYLPRKADETCLKELRRIYDQQDIQTARQTLSEWLKKWGGSYSRLCAFVEDNIEETLSFYQLPEAHRKRMRSTNMLERLNEELRRRTRVVRIFPNEASCLRLARAICVEKTEEWIGGKRYLDMKLLPEQKKANLMKLAV